MSFNKHDAERLYKKLREEEPNQPGLLGVPPSGVGIGVSGTVALAASPATQTDVVDNRIDARTVMYLAPADLYGSAEVGAGNIYWNSPAAGIMRIFHTVSTKTRTFRYLLMFSLVLLLAGGAFGQQILDNGTPLEVRPKLNFQGAACTLDAPEPDAYNCDVTAGSPGDMLMANYATGAYWGNDPTTWVDNAQIAQSAMCLDGNNDNVCELVTNGGAGTGTIDINGDTCFELSFTPASINWFTTTCPVPPCPAPNPCVSNPAQLSVISSGAEMVGQASKMRMGNGFQIGNGLGTGTSVASANSSGIGREATSDRLFADRNVNFSTVQTRQVGAINANDQIGGIERYLENDNEVKRLTADFVTNVTAGSGAAISGLTVAENGVHTLDVTYTLLVQSNSASFATTGVAFGVNYTHATATAPFICTRTVPTDDSLGAGAPTGKEEDVHTGGTTGKSYEFWETQTETSATPDMGPTAGFLTQSSSVLETIHCLMTTPSGAGSVELYIAASAANNVTVKAGSWVNVIQIE